MAFTRRATQRERKGSFFFRYVSSSALRREKNDRVITVTLYSNPLSSVAISECPPYLGVYVLLPVFLRGRRMCGCVRAGEGDCECLGPGAAALFNLLTPQWGGVGCKELSGQDLAPPEQNRERR